MEVPGPGMEPTPLQLSAAAVRFLTHRTTAGTPLSLSFFFFWFLEIFISTLKNSYNLWLQMAPVIVGIRHTKHLVWDLKGSICKSKSVWSGHVWGWTRAEPLIPCLLCSDLQPSSGCYCNVKREAQGNGVWWSACWFLPTDFQMPTEAYYVPGMF